MRRLGRFLAAPLRFEVARIYALVALVALGADPAIVASLFAPGWIALALLGGAFALVLGGVAGCLAVLFVEKPAATRVVLYRQGREPEDVK